MFGAVSEKFRTFDMQIIFAIPPNFSLFSVVVGNLFPFIKVTKFLSLYQSIRCVIIGHSTTVPKYPRQLRSSLRLQSQELDQKERPPGQGQNRESGVIDILN